MSMLRSLSVGYSPREETIVCKNVPFSVYALSSWDRQVLELIDDTPCTLVAGGSVFQWIRKCPPNDLDVYCLSRLAAVSMHCKLRNTGWKTFKQEEREGYNISKMKRGENHFIDLIETTHVSFTRNKTPTDLTLVQSVIDTYDISVCQVAMIGMNKFYISRVAEEDLKLSRFHVLDEVCLDSKSTLRRIEKYKKRGLKYMGIIEGGEINDLPF